MLAIVNYLSALLATRERVAGVEAKRSSQPCASWELSLVDPNHPNPLADLRRNRAKRHRRRARRGTLYLSVMGAAFIVSTVALIAAHQAHLNLQTAQTINDRFRAQLLARSAVEQGLTEINANVNWLTAYAYDTEYPSPAVPVNGGTFNWKLVNAGNGSRRLDGIGRVGKAVCVNSVNLAGRDYLACGLSSGGNMSLDLLLDSMQVTGAPAATQMSFINRGTVTANVEAKSITNTGTIVGTQTSSAPSRPLPNPMTVFDYYVAQGTTLATTVVDRMLISPNAAPGGPINPLGIYVINANGGSVAIRSSRIVGTIVILNALGGVTIENQINWEPALPNYPALLVQGSLVFMFDNSKLSESSLGINFNPPLTPWQNQTDLANDDDYPSAMAGIIYCSGNLTFDGGNAMGKLQTFEGMLIAGGTCSLAKRISLFVDYDAAFHNNPPPGFIPGDPRNIIPGTWRQTKSN